jgi:hypothetical protein
VLRSDDRPHRHEGDVDSLQLAGELLLIVSLTTLLARNYRQALQRVTELKLKADGLLVQLRAEKATARLARSSRSGPAGGRHRQPREDAVLRGGEP